MTPYRLAPIFLFAGLLLVTTSVAAANFPNTPLTFEPNQGQTDARVAYLAHNVFFTSQGAVLNLPVHGGHLAVRMNFAAAPAEITGERRLPGHSNYLVGDRAHWHTGIAQFARVRYRQVSSGADFIFYGTGRNLEYDIVLAPGADPRGVRLGFEGVEGLSVASNGDLVLHTKAGDLRQIVPQVYQGKNGSRRRIACRYVLRGNNEVGFALGARDRNVPVVIDPVLRWSTLLGGSGTDVANGIAVDSNGHAYLTGQTDSPNFPTTVGVIERTSPGSTVAFVTKFNWDGSSVDYSTYFGGTAGRTVGNRIRVDSSGNAYIAGQTTSSDLPVSTSAFQKMLNGSSDAFAAKLNAGGNALVYSTYLGGSGSDGANGIAINSAGNAYVTGYTGSSNFPTTVGVFQSTKHSASGSDVFVTQLNTTGSALVYSTYLGGSDQNTSNSNGQIGNSIAVDGSGNAYVSGTTLSSTFPVTAGAFQRTFGGAGDFPTGDVFVTKLNTTGTALVYSTYLGGSDDEDVGSHGDMTIDSAGNAYVTGDSMSSNFPTTAGAFNSPGSCGPFLAKLNAGGSALVYSAHWDVGGPCSSSGAGVAVDSGGHAYVIGTTGAEWPDMTFVRPFQMWIGGPLFEQGEMNAFFLKMNATGTAPDVSSLLGGTGINDAGLAIALDSGTNAYVAGATNSSDFPVSQNAFRKTNAGGTDAFVAKIIPLCDAGAGDPSVTICFPGNAITTTSPTVITATTRDSSAVTRMEVWVDFVKVYQAPLSSIWVKLLLAAGQHRVTVQATDRNNAFFKKTVNITIAP